MTVDDHNELAERVRKHFFMRLDEKAFFDLLDKTVDKLPDAQKDVALAFRYNLLAASYVAALPFTLANFADVAKRTKTDLTDKLEALKSEGLSEQELKERSVQIAVDHIVNLRKRDDSNIPPLLESMLEPVDRLKGYSLTLRELLRQAAVLVWGALEVLTTDCYRLWKGKDPQSPGAAFHEMIPYYDSGMEFMKDLDLFKLFLSRHLIVHRRAIIDQKFIDRTGAKAPLGAELIVTPEELEEYFHAALITGISVLVLSSQPPGETA